MTVKYSGDTALANDIVSITVFKSNDEKRVTVTVDPPEGSTFTLESKAEFNELAGARIYLPSTALRNDGKDRLFLVIWLDTGEEEK